ncbi:MAG: ABC transporter permease subunit [Thermoanaerobaculia bacterium]
MAVFDRRYRPWDGARTSAFHRLLVLPRYAYRDLFASRLFTGLYFGSFLPPLGCAVAIWAVNNAPLLAKLGIETGDLLKINASFFLWLLGVQFVCAAAQTLVIAPALVSPDLVNGALPLYLSRPVSRAQYVAGKFAVLAVLLSTITWVPGLLLFGLQSSVASGPWAASHLRIAPGLVIGSLLGITVLSVLGLAVSAFVRRRAIARGVFIGFLVITAAIGENLNHALDTCYGSMLSVFVSMKVICSWLLGWNPTRNDSFGDSFSDRGGHLPVSAAVLSLAFLIVCALLLLRRRLRAVEVVS